LFVFCFFFWGGGGGGGRSSIVLWNLIQYFYSGANGIGKGHYCHFGITDKSAMYFLCLSSWLRQLVLYPSLWRPMLVPDCWWMEWHWAGFFSEYFDYPLSVRFHQCCTCVSFVYYWCCIILAIDSIVQWNTSLPQIFSVVDFHTERKEFCSIWH